jgi:flagellin-like protein
MNELTMSQRRWRKKAKRGVSPIIATILLVAITVVLAAVLYILISGLTKGPGNTPLGTALALSNPNEAAKGPNFWYNFSVQSAGGGITLNSMNFQTVNAAGSIVTPTGWTMVVLGLTGANVGTYNLVTGAWTAGGASALTSSMTLVLDATANLSGDTLNVVGAGSFQGSISVSIQ